MEKQISPTTEFQCPDCGAELIVHATGGMFFVPGQGPDDDLCDHLVCPDCGYEEAE